MRVAIVSHSYVLNGNRGKVHAVARLPGLDVLLIVPQKWTNRDIGQRLRAEPPGVRPLSVAALPAWPDSSGSLITYDPFALLRVLKRFRPDLVHVEEEPWSFAALELSLICHRLGVPFTFFTWENTDRRLFLPFSLIRRRVLRQARAAVAGNTEAKAILERHGFCNAVSVLPQLGVDTCTFSPPGGSAESRDTIVGYVGRLVPQKGLLLLLEAVPQLPANVRLMMVGNGPLKSELLGKARALGVEDRFELHDGVPHHDVPRHLARVSILVLPSLTTPTWKEQFGHILIEAMASGVPVIGSDSGAIPEVIDDAGLIVPEGDLKALVHAVRKLASEPALRAELASRGRARALATYTNETIARRLGDFWQHALSNA